LNYFLDNSSPDRCKAVRSNPHDLHLAKMMAQELNQLTQNLCLSHRPKLEVLQMSVGFA